MSFYKRLRSLGLKDDAAVVMTYEEGCDVHHYTDDFIDNAIQATGILDTLAEAITSPPLYNSPSNHVLEEMRDNGLLEDYARGDEDFGNYVWEVLGENHWDYDWFERETERYDYKRGFTTFRLAFDMKVSDFKDCTSSMPGWTAEVVLDDGHLIISN
jgi:aryl-phospho-beta-D-glucosidase BglC (GH1 family)